MIANGAYFSYTHQQDVPPNSMPYPQFFLQPQKQSVKREVNFNLTL